VTQRNGSNRNGPAEHSADLRLVREILAGRSDAVERFIGRMRCVPLILAKRNARRGSFLNNEDIEDLTQEVLAIVLRKLDTYAGRSSLETWVYSICTKQMMNTIRSRQRRPVLVGDDTGGGSLDQAAVLDPPPDEYELVNLCLDRLDSFPAEVIRLKVFDDMTFKQIGRRLDIPENSAKTHFYRGVDRLRLMLQPLRSEED
jgi:RNA polymerase sigma factor (sigma-70 family)